MNEKNLKELSKYHFLKEKLLKGNEYTTVNPDNETTYLNNQGSEYYFCEVDNLVNTRILFGIFKCVNFIKNIILAGLICGSVGFAIMLIKLFS